MLQLSAPRVHAANAYMYRNLKLDQTVFAATAKILARELEGKNFQTRETLNEVFAKNMIVASGLRLGYIFMHAELEGLICSGPRDGKQFTYALLDERVGETKSLSREEALTEFTKRYFFSRGPATIKDFVKWSGLTVKDVKQGVADLGKKLSKFSIGGEEYFYKDDVIKEANDNATFLMPDYDEYGMAYKDRSVFIPQSKAVQQKFSASSEYAHWLIVDGRFAGRWERKQKTKAFDGNTIFKIK
jgi:hypothetical protein